MSRISSLIDLLILRFSPRGEESEEEIFSSAEPALPPASQLETPETVMPETPPLEVPQALLPEVGPPYERMLHFPAALEFPEIAAVSSPEISDPAESFIRRISWDERRFSQSMTEVD